MSFTYTERDLKRMEGLHPDLKRVLMRAAVVSDIVFMVVEGVRTDEQCYINWGKGRTATELQRAGVPVKYAAPKAAKVTWLKNPLSSNHRRRAGYGRAVDLLPAPYDWKNPKDFDRMAQAMLQAAKEEQVHIRWGADWDEDGRPRERGETDSPHFELAA